MDWGGANLRFLGLVSVWAARSLEQTALRPSVIKRIRQNDVTYITHMQSVLPKRIYGNVHKKMKKRRPCKNNMASVRSKNKTVVLRMKYKNHIKMYQRFQPPVVELAVL